MTFLVDYAPFEHPLFKLGICVKSQYLTGCLYIVMTCGLIHEHDIIAVRNCHYIVAAACPQHYQQIIHCTLVTGIVVGVAHIAAHGQTVHMAAEIIFQTCSQNLIAAIEVFGADKAYHCIYDKWVIVPCKAVAA